MNTPSEQTYKGVIDMPTNFNIVLFDTKGQTVKSINVPADTKIGSLDEFRALGAVRAVVARGR